MNYTRIHVFINVYAIFLLFISWIDDIGTWSQPTGPGIDPLGSYVGWDASYHCTTGRLIYIFLDHIVILLPEYIHIQYFANFIFFMAQNFPVLLNAWSQYSPGTCVLCFRPMLNDHGCRGWANILYAWLSELSEILAICVGFAGSGRGHLVGLIVWYLPRLNLISYLPGGI